MKHTFIQRMCVALGLLCFAVSSALGQAAPLQVTINAKAGLQYDVVRFEAKPASKVELKLVNNDDMAHNIVLTKPGQREAVGSHMDYSSSSRARTRSRARANLRLYRRGACVLLRYMYATRPRPGARPRACGRRPREFK